MLVHVYNAELQVLIMRYPETVSGCDNIVTMLTSCMLGRQSHSLCECKNPKQFRVLTIGLRHSRRACLERRCTDGDDVIELLGPDIEEVRVGQYVIV